MERHGEARLTFDGGTIVVAASAEVAMGHVLGIGRALRQASGSHLWRDPQRIIDPSVSVGEAEIPNTFEMSNVLAK
jgi:hypothetical protein